MNHSIPILLQAGREVCHNHIRILTSKTENAILYFTAIYAIAEDERVIHLVRKFAQRLSKRDVSFTSYPHICFAVEHKR